MPLNTGSTVLLESKMPLNQRKFVDTFSQSWPKRLLTAITHSYSGQSSETGFLPIKILAPPNVEQIYHFITFDNQRSPCNLYPLKVCLYGNHESVTIVTGTLEKNQIYMDLGDESTSTLIYKIFL